MTEKPIILDDEIEEGSPCNQNSCAGQFARSHVYNCSCHISPPCEACVDAGYTCDTCGYDTAQQEQEATEYSPSRKVADRSNGFTMTEVSDPYNSTPFTRCCGVASFGERCEACNAQITGHDDGLADRRKWAKGGCLMCGKPVGDIKISGNCCC